MNEKKTLLLRGLPSVESLLSHEKCSPLIEEHGRDLVTATLRGLLEAFRKQVIAGEPHAEHVQAHHWINEAKKLLKAEAQPNLRKMLNLSGVIVHTNLGRAILADEAVKAVTMAAQSCVNLEYNIEKGERGDRDDLVEELIVKLTGAGAATCVNNNAAGVLLALNSLSDGGETIISRGELVEIGGSFRIHEIMKKSGCKLVEVGTTNRTHISDYEDAITEDTSLILKAHTSNYKVVGFTAMPHLPELCTLAHSKNLPVMVDLGSGALINFSVFGAEPEPTVQETIQNGADIVTFSCDKLLGGPQAGIIAGSKDLIKRIKKNHLKRALRTDKMTLAALEATLRLYKNRDKALTAIPTLRHLTKSMDEIRNMAQITAEVLVKWFGPNAEISLLNDTAQAGAGSAPQVELPSVSVAIRSKIMNPNKLAQWFKALEIPIIGRVKDDIFRLDMRTLDDVEEIKRALPQTALKPEI
ncbi:L-seryl-tRNA(Sec) selenium transferase [hydrothermal vent metagenome]|uniref:L-seryl-tRNA(Sec) selenium transferase n=1 Tax=hydrothermal vent metagenome TaxID=652676 RepID=A0A3B1BZA3_9ZZZZ